MRQHTRVVGHQLGSQEEGEYAPVLVALLLFFTHCQFLLLSSLLFSYFFEKNLLLLVVRQSNCLS